MGEENFSILCSVTGLLIIAIIIQGVLLSGLELRVFRKESEVLEKNIVSIFRVEE
jgi:hypothetical protein